MDAVFEASGQFGNYQLLTVIVPMIVTFLSPGYMLASVYVNFSPKHRCKLPADSPWSNNDSMALQGVEHLSEIQKYIPNLANSSEWDSCKILINDSSVTCNSWIYDNYYFHSTLTTELDLICDRVALKTLMSTCTFAGVTIGVICGGYLADLIGRRKSLIITLWLLTASLLASTFAVSPAYLAAVRFFTGAAGLSSSTICYVIMFELIGSKARHHMAAFNAYGWCSGVLYGVAIAYLTGSWRGYYIGFLIPTAIALAAAHVPLLSPETPRWLVSRGRVDEACAAVEKIFKFNRVKPEIQQKAMAQFRRNLHLLVENDNQALTLCQSIRQLIKSPRMLCSYGITCLNWITVSVVYYGIALGVKNLPGSIFITSSLLGATEFIPNLVIHVTASRIGRKTSFIFSMAASGLFLLALCAVSWWASHLTWLITTLSVIGRSFNCAAFTLIYMWTGELYATNMRLAGLSTSSMSARIGTLFAPLLSNIRDFIPGQFGLILSYLIFSGISCLSSVISCSVPETLGSTTPDSVKVILEIQNDKNLKLSADDCEVEMRDLEKSANHSVADAMVSKDTTASEKL